MIEIEFKPIATVESAARGIRFSAEPAIAIEQDHFVAHVTILIDGVMILGRESYPLFFVAAAGLEVIDALPSTRSEDLYIPGISGLRFRCLDDDSVEIQNIARGERGITSYQELRDAWKGFSEKVRDYLVRLAPDLVNHPDLGAWFRGEQL
jgi:hypothetical protein